VQDTAGQVADQARDAWAALSKFFRKKLPSGVELNIPELGVENRLIAFIEDAQRPVDEKLWFSFDRLTFETGKATLKPESQEQLKNIAESLVRRDCIAEGGQVAKSPYKSVFFCGSGILPR